MKIIDPGHHYLLLTLDEPHDIAGKQHLVFVKRCDPICHERYPGNYDQHPGTTLQSVIRCLIERVAYLQNQIACPENAVIKFMLKLCLWLLEFRAARRHGQFYMKSIHFAVTAKMCTKCGPTICRHNP